MSSLKQLIREIHHRSLWQVLAIYAGASWVVFEIVQTLTEGLGLPEWFPAFAFVLLLVGLPIVLATAFVQKGIGGDGVERARADAEPSADVPERRGHGEGADETGGPGLRRLLTWRNALAGGVLAFAVWGVIAAGWLLVAGTPAEEAGGPSEGIRPEPAVAVLPFNVRGEGLEVWREGMVDLLSTGLDGVAGLRAIDSRTVLARWNERVGDERAPDRTTALQVARATGARYAVLGSAVSVGPEVRLVADVYRVPDGQLLGHPQVQGSPDSVLGLVDRFAVESLLLMLQQGERELPRIDLASVTTRSVPALRAWLEGESHFRRAEFNPAISAYERALEHDSAFALVHYRLASAYGWAEGIGSDRASEALDRAVRWIERLPAREATLVRAYDARDRGSLDGLEPLRELVQRHPDDAQAWYELGETYYHGGWRANASLEDAETTFRRALELDPKFAPYHLHVINIAFKREPDSTRVRRLIDGYERLSPDSRHIAQNALAFDLAFGDEEHRRRARAALDTVDLRILRALPNEYLLHPRHAEAFEAALLALERRGPADARPGRRFRLFEMATFGTGRLERGLSYLDEPGLPPFMRPCLPIWARSLGVPVPDDRLEAPPDAADPEADFHWRLLECRGELAALQGRWAEHRRTIERLRQEAERVAAEDSVEAEDYRAVADGLEALGLARQGKHREALRRLEAIPPGQRHVGVRWWLAQLYMETGRWREAIPYLRSFIWQPFAHADYYLGQAYEELGEPEEARRAYARFIAAWDEADPELQSFVESARRALERLTGERTT